MSDRRTFLIQMGAMTASVSVSSAAWGALGGVDYRRGANVVPVVGFFLDQPYLDFTGQATPYVPPAGLRSAEALAKAVDADFHRGIWFGLERDQS